MTDIFYGTKKLKARALTRQEYVDYRGWELPSDEDGSDLGYLVEYLDGGAANDERHEGYISWSPKAVFDAAYTPTGAMSYSHALIAIKSGHKVARSGWNGKGMWVALTPASTFPSVHAKEGHAAKHRADEFDEGGTVIHLNAHIDMKTADGSMCIGWLASQADQLTDDWSIVQ